MTSKENRQINTQRAILDIISPMDHEIMMRYIDIMCDRYRFMSMNYIGESILGRGIPMITLGNGKKQVMYIGAFSGADHICSMLLLRFINEYCEVKKRGGRIYNYSIEYLFATRRICVIPMLNVDGVDININGVSEDNILKERILSMNNGRRFTEWKANSRGVSLNKNFNFEFSKYKTEATGRGICSGAPQDFCGECPESEPEVGALCSNIRYCDDLKATVAIGSGGEKIFYRTEKVTPIRGKSIAEALSRACGYRLQDSAEGEDTYGSFFGWCIEELGIPSFEILCGKKNERYPETYFELYARLREILFTLPAII